MCCSNFIGCLLHNYGNQPQSLCIWAYAEELARVLECYEIKVACYEIAIIMLMPISFNNDVLNFYFLFIDSCYFLFFANSNLILENPPMYNCSVLYLKW